MSLTNFGLKKIFTQPEFECCEFLEIAKFGSKEYLLVTDWASGLHIFEIAANPFNNTSSNFNSVEYKCLEAQEKNISGLCVLSDKSSIFLLFCNGWKKRSKIVEFKFNSESSSLLNVVKCSHLNYLDRKGGFFDLKLLSPSRCELAFLQRKNGNFLHIFNYENENVVKSSLNIMKVLSENGYREAGTRSFQFVEEKYLFLTDHEYFRVLNNNNEVQIGNNCVHLLKIEYNNQTYVITYLRRIRDDFLDVLISLENPLM